MVSGAALALTSSRGAVVSLVAGLIVLTAGSFDDFWWANRPIQANVLDAGFDWD